MQLGGGATTTVVGITMLEVRVKALWIMTVASVVSNVDGTNSVWVTVIGTWSVLVITAVVVGVTVTVDVLVVVTVDWEMVVVAPVTPAHEQAEE